METKRNAKYFTAPPVSVLGIIGWAIALVGVVMFCIEYLRIYGILVLIAGFAVVIFTSGGKSNDTDLEYQISEKIKDLQEMSEKKFEVYERSFLKMLKPINLRGYDFDTTETPFYYKKGADGIQRTNYFVGCNLIFSNEKTFIYARRFSLVDEAIDEVNAVSFFYNELDRAVIEEKVYEAKKGDRVIPVKYYVFKILKMDGEPALSMCVDYGADIDKYAQQITRAIETRKVELAKRAEEAAERRAAFRAKVEAEKEAIAKGELVVDDAE